MTADNSQQASDLIDQGLAAAEQKDYLRALELFERAAELEPENVDALYNMGVAAGQLYFQDASMEEYYKWEDTDDEATFFAIAESALERALELDPSHEEAAHNLKMLRETGQ